MRGERTVAAPAGRRARDPPSPTSAAYLRACRDREEAPPDRDPPGPRLRCGRGDAWRLAVHRSIPPDPTGWGGARGGRRGRPAWLRDAGARDLRPDLDRRGTRGTRRAARPDGGRRDRGLRARRAAD